MYIAHLCPTWQRLSHPESSGGSFTDTLCWLEPLFPFLVPLYMFSPPGLMWTFSQPDGMARFLRDEPVSPRDVALEVP